ncbi:MAG: hypothetical protein KGH64_02735 [Candidatus Micrarchaeota archaeon]|nr:hypothetical protein [Candidatus Micrarchaeota archaeon]MDE1859300.1 hypothetical protein [Candidatus Micrarchaeota archaeon]
MVDDNNVVKRLGSIKSNISETSLRENYKQLSFFKKELLKKKIGVLSLIFPKSWMAPNEIKSAVHEESASPIDQAISGSAMLLFQTYDSGKMTQNQRAMHLDL